jgi:gliding motility-associated lipoprotein GldH
MKSTKHYFSFFLLFITSITFVSCDRGPVYENYLKMKNTVWDRFDIKQFDIPIAKPAKSYDITVVVKCTDQFTYDNLPFYVIITTPSGEERMREVNVPVRENGKLITAPDGTNAEARMLLWKNISMADKGNCKITLENMIPKIQTEGIDEIGIVVTESK